MTKELLVALIGLITAVLSGSLTYIWTRRKYMVETKSTELDNIEKAVSIWRNLTQKLEEGQAALKLEVDQLHKQMKDLEENFQKKCENCKYRKHYYEHKEQK
jgi:hypothetical protein